MNNKDEKLLREFVRRTIVKPAMQVLKEEKRREDAVRLWVRSHIREFIEQDYYTIIKEAKDMANPHPNTGINKLRDAIRKAKPSIKSKFQQLTTSSEQRESFRNHLLAAFVRLFDQLDALSAEGEAEDVAADADLAAEPAEADTLQAPDESDIDDIEKELDALLESLNLREDRESQAKLASKQYRTMMKSIEASDGSLSSDESAEEVRAVLNNYDEEGNPDAKKYKDMGFDEEGLRILIQSLENESDPSVWAFNDKDNDVVSNDLEAEKESSKNLSQVEKDVEKKKAQEREREEFGAGLEGDSTGRNQAYDTFNLVQSYFSDAYLDLNNGEDKEMYKKWGLYNLKLLLDSYEEELSPAGEAPDIQNPQ
jgi:hypothetical protein